MPLEQGYQSQLDPREGQAMPGGNAQGAMAVGAAIEQAGAMVHEQQVRAYSIEQKQLADQELADAERKFSQWKLDRLDQVLELRETAGPGAAGHAKAVAELNARGREQVLSGITHPNVQRHMAAQWDEDNGRLLGGETVFEQGKRIAKLVSDVGDANNLSSNVVRRSGGDQKVYAAELNSRFTSIAQLHTDEETREKLYKDAERAVGTGHLLGLIDRDPAEALKQIESKAFEHLPADLLEQLRGAAEVEQRRAEAAAEHQRNVAMSQGKDAIEALKVRYNDGVEIPDGEFTAAISFAEKAGDASQVEQLRGMQADNVFARVYSGQTPLARQNRVAALAAKPKRSAAEDRELKWLKDHREPLDARFGSDPVGFAIDNAPAGTKPPAGDVFGNPGVLAARVDWWRTNKPVYGSQLEVFTKAEVEHVRSVRGQGPQGEQQALGWLDQLGDPAARLQAARQIAPKDDAGDSLFRHLALISPPARQPMMRGQEALKANPRMLTPETKDKRKLAWIGELEGDAGRAMRTLRPADAEATRTLARWYVAGQMSGMGWSIDEVPREMWIRAYRQALGGGVLPNGRGAVGGMAYWGDHAYLLPSRHNTSTFAAELLADSKRRKVQPVNPDGSFADVKYAVPVFMGVDPQDPQVWRYRFESAGGRVVQSSAGGDYIALVRDR